MIWLLSFKYSLIKGATQYCVGAEKINPPLGQMTTYLTVLDDTVRKPHENPSIGLILCRDMNKAFVDYVIRDYAKPLGVATYSTTKDMSEKMKNALPDPEELNDLYWHRMWKIKNNSMVVTHVHRGIVFTDM